VSKPGEGATVNIHTGEEPTSGWAVAQHGAEHIEPAQTLTRHSIEAYTNEHADALRRAGHLGLWHDEGTGVYHDATKMLPDSYRGGAGAIAEGYRQRQVSVYNIDRGHTLYMEPKGRGEQRDTRQAVGALRKMHPQERIADLPTAELARRFRERR
jgi:hypothetical protein